VRHVVSGLDLDDDAETEAEHPVFRRHPVSGRTSLYLSTPQRCVGISGMADDEARETIEFLYAHSTAEDNVHRHRWSPGDVVMWDNGCVLHRADHGGVVGDRVMHRGMVAATGGS
jgi:taurine dioxygenase